MERWSAIDAEDVHLATIRVYHNAKNESGKSPRILLMLPPPPENPDEPGEEFELDMVNESVENQFVIAEREKEPGTASRARTTRHPNATVHRISLGRRTVNTVRAHASRVPFVAGTTTQPHPVFSQASC